MKINGVNKSFPLIMALCIAGGVVLGYYLTINALNNGGRKEGVSNKLDLLMDVIHREYVDSLSDSSVIEKAIPHILAELDPHSKYIPSKDVEAINKELEGTFSGIGVIFILKEDTITVTEVVAGGPSEKAGLLKGDRIVRINDTLYAGINLKQGEVMKKLRGRKDSKVKLGIRRMNLDELKSVTVTRGDIPVSSVDVSYKVSDDIGYIKIAQFGSNTYQDFLLAIAKLKKQQCNSFIIDLRDNPGGFLDATINMVNEFLPAGKLIVYTQGKAYPRNESYSNGEGSCQNAPVIVLIDEISASASEIFAGAIQDNDRGLIIGRRSFGKGLVQSQPSFSDGSAIRLTIARYYTPTGRCIQKPYKPGKDAEYEDEVYQRYLHGEFSNQDSIKQNDSLRYTTPSGRVVYGGGGITPDIFVPLDSLGWTTYSKAVITKGLIPMFSFNYVEAHAEELKEYNHYWPLLQYLNELDLLSDFVDYAETKGISRRPYLIDISRNMLDTYIKAFIGQYLLGDEAYYPIIFQLDATYKRAVQEMKTKSNPLLTMSPQLMLNNVQH